MANPQKKEEVERKNVVGLFDSHTSTTKRISNTHTEELVIALCGPIGSPLHEVAQTIEDNLKNIFGYTDCKRIRLSSLIEEHAHRVETTIPANASYERVTSLIDAGNALRKKYGNGILAELAVHKIRLDRQQHYEADDAQKFSSRRICHIIDSIKNQEELDLLRVIYREMLYVVGVFVPLNHRVENLQKKGLQTHEVYSLIDRDSGEESKSGQTVRDTFPQSDFFLRMDSGTDSQLKGRVERFLHLILGTKIITPTANETAMYAAASAASNSACLSRQVGASVTNKIGEVISVGWNDVPKYGGSLYSYEQSDPNGDHDKRCWNLDGGKCSNDDEKDIFSSQIISQLAEHIKETELNLAKEKISSFYKLRGLIEFSRSIHAEMHAILNAGKTDGSQLKDGKLFVTTYPCHSCARHIIAAGIVEVYYIEPYRKSLAIKLHGDAITEQESDGAKVRILPYDGVSPGRYLTLFKAPINSRKKNGRLIKISPQESKPRSEKSLEALPNLESMVVKSLEERNLIEIHGGVINEERPEPA